MLNITIVTAPNMNLGKNVEVLNGKGDKSSEFIALFGEVWHKYFIIAPKVALDIVFVKQLVCQDWSKCGLRKTCVCL